MNNLEIAQIFYEIADLLEIEGVRFIPRAYRRAAQAIETLPKPLREIHERRELENIPGIGSRIAAKVIELLETGRLEYLEELRKKLPQGLTELMKVEGIGPKTVLTLHRKLKISGIDQLEVAAKQGKLRGLKGFGEKTEENILQGIAMYRSGQERSLLGYALPLAVEVKESLEKCDAVIRISLAGSIRRRKETIGDVDILVTSDEPLKVMNYFANLPQVNRVIAKGRTKSSVLLTNNLQVDVRVVDEGSFGSALQYFTGSKEHNIKLRRWALKRDWKLSEYSLQDTKTNRIIAGEDEASIYESFDLEYIEPELREDWGEVEAAFERKLPRLVRYCEVRGDLHVHTEWSDGAHSIREMAEEAKRLGLEYIAVCDHSKTLRIAGGLTEEDLIRQMEEIRKISDELDGFKVLSGVEANIKADGSLDVENRVLRDIDIVVASVHSGFKQPRKEMTERLLTAIHNDHVNVIGHPTGRIINKRKPYQVDLPKVFEAAKAQGVFMEINALPNRLDLSAVNCLKARDYGVKTTIGSDAHNKDQLTYIELGVATARRGWLRSEDVANTLTAEELVKALRK